MTMFRWAENAHDVLTVASLSVTGGLAFGLAYGWPVGVGVAAGVVLVFVGVARMVAAVRRKALQSRVPQRSVVQRRFPGRR